MKLGTEFISSRFDPFLGLFPICCISRTINIHQSAVFIFPKHPCQHRPSGVLKMSLFSTAEQNHLSSSVEVFIKVLDINDNVPRLARDYQPYICEGTQAGEVCILWCTDVHDLLQNGWAVTISVLWMVSIIIIVLKEHFNCSFSSIDGLFSYNTIQLSSRKATSSCTRFCAVFHERGLWRVQMICS